MIQPDSPWRGKRVFVTGIGGFLGSAVAERLLALGADVVGLSHEHASMQILRSEPRGRCHLLHGRIDNIFRLHSAMAVHEVSAVFHLVEQEDDAQRGLATLLQAVRLYSASIPVVCSRSGNPADGEGFEGDARYSVVRFGELFGPGDRSDSRMISRAIRARLTAVPSLHLTTDSQRDCVFIRDAVAACFLAAESASRSETGDYTFQSGWLLSERDVVESVRDLAAGVPPAVRFPHPAHNPLGWSPSLPFHAALRETIEWYRGDLQFQTANRRAAA